MKKLYCNSCRKFLGIYWTDHVEGLRTDRLRCGECYAKEVTE